MKTENGVINKIKYYIDVSLKKGFSYIVISSLLNKVIVLASTIALNRLLSQTDYGDFSYAYNIISMIIVISSLGVDVALLQFCCENRPEEEKKSLEKYALVFGLVSNTVFACVTFIVSSNIRSNLKDSMSVLAKLAFLLPIPFIVSYCSTILRSLLNNKRYALLTNISSLAYLGGVIIFVNLLGLKGAIIGRYLGFLVPAVFGILFLKNRLRSLGNIKMPNKTLKKAFLVYGLTVTLTNSVSSLLYYIDIYVVGRVTSNSISIASYKTATIIPNALAALPAIIVTFIYPYFAKNKDNHKWIIKYTKTIQVFAFVGSLFIALILAIFAPQIITLAFGKKYLSALVPFRILLISFVISGPFRVISGNVIAMLGKVRVNFYIGLVSCLINIVLDCIFIKLWGSVGAAIATTIIMAIASIMSNYYLYKVYGKQ